MDWVCQSRPVHGGVYVDGALAGATITDCKNGNWLCYSNLNLGTGYSRFTADLSIPKPYAGKFIDVRLDSLTGFLAGTLQTTDTKSFMFYFDESTSLSGAKGMHDVYICFRSDDPGTTVANINWFRFDSPASLTNLKP
jgi:hypothetical protein